MAETTEEASKTAAKAVYHQTGAQSAFGAKLQSFSAEATMGDYRGTDADRADLHDALDVMLDSTIEVIRLNRRVVGLE